MNRRASSVRPARSSAAVIVYSIRSRWARLPPNRSCVASSGSTLAIAAVPVASRKGREALRERRHACRRQRLSRASVSLASASPSPAMAWASAVCMSTKASPEFGNHFVAYSAEIAPEFGLARLARHLGAEQERGAVGQHVDLAGPSTRPDAGARDRSARPRARRPVSIVHSARCQLTWQWIWPSRG